MTVHKDDAGRRRVEAEVEVPGTPEEVWKAIATGPGISSWFVPTTLEERAGGETVSSFGPGMDSVARITRWDPPHSFCAETNELGPNDPSVATEWIVEAKGGGECIVRVVHTWAAQDDKWDQMFEGHVYGWLSFFRVLRLYLAAFPGETGGVFQVMTVSDATKEEVWAEWLSALGFSDPKVGHRVEAGQDAPPIAGVVEWAGAPGRVEELVIRLDVPRNGIAHLVPHPMGGKVYFSLRVFLYGVDADAELARQEALWRNWAGERFSSA